MFIDRKQKFNKYNTKNHNVKYGFLNKHDNTSLFINITSWVKIINDEDIDFNKIFNKKNKEIKTYLHNLNLSFNNNHYVVVMNIRQNGFVFNTESYLDVEITLFCKNSSSPLTPSKKLDKEVKEVINYITNEILHDSENFTYKHKK